MLMIRFQPRRVPNIVVGLTLFWCGILSAFFWTKGFNLNFIFSVALTVLIGFFMASTMTEHRRNNLLAQLGYDPARGIPVTDRNAFSIVEKGVFSSIGKVPFQYPFPARLNSNHLEHGKFSQIIHSKIPKEILSSEAFLDKFICAIDSGPHVRLIKAILEIYCHPEHINLPAGITRHNGELLVTHCLRVAALMLHRVDNFSFKNYYVCINDPDFKLAPDDALLVIIGLAHDLGKINSFVKDNQGSVIELKKNHHKSSSRLVTSLPEFWDKDLSPNDRFIIQAACIYSAEYSSSPISASLIDQSKPYAISDRLQFLIDLLISSDVLASKIENGFIYDFESQLSVVDNQEIPSIPSDLSDDKLDLFTTFSEFIATKAVINGKGDSRSAGLKYIDNIGDSPKHFLFMHEDEFSTAFANYINKPDWGAKGGKSRTYINELLKKLDEAGYLVRPPGVGAQPAINCLYKVQFVKGDPPLVVMSFNSCFIVDLTEWPNQNKLRSLPSCDPQPVISNSIFGNKFTQARRSVNDDDVFEALGINGPARSASSNIESLIAKKQESKPNEIKSLNNDAVILRIKKGLRKGTIVPAMLVPAGEPIPIANNDAFFANLGINVAPSNSSDQKLEAVGITHINASKKIEGTHIVFLNQTIYSQ